MDNQQFTIISDLIVKYMMSTISEEEKRSLDAWISEREENEVLFHKIISSENLYGKLDRFTGNKYEKAYEAFIAVKDKPRKNKVLLNKILKYVAIIIVIIVPLCGIYFYGDREEQPFLETSTHQRFDVPILKLSNGKIIRFDSVGEIMVDEIAASHQLPTSENDTMKHPDKTVKEEELSYNELIVPDRCRHKIVLSDKSVVWVNSNTSLRYPTSFGKKERRVYITGEALFEVTKDSLRPFIVETNSLSVNVTGTLFNVNDYAEQSDIKVTLINGNIQSIVKDQCYELLPNQQLIFNRENNSTEIREVIAEDYALWIDGIYVFNRIKLKDILVLIERCYGISCHLKNHEYLEMEITGELNINKGLISFVELLSKCSEFKFSLDRDTIIIQ